MKTSIIQCYAKLERINNLTGKTPRYDCTAFAGNYYPFEKLKNNKGELFFYLMERIRSNRKAPEVSLQGRDSINLTGLFHYWENGLISGFCHGYPSNKEMLARVKPFKNPFYQSNSNDGFLFVIHQATNTTPPTSIEILVLSDARESIDLYRDHLKRGGFNDILEKYRERATSTNVYYNNVSSLPICGKTNTPL